MILVADERVFLADSPSAADKLVLREISTANEVRILDSNWLWYQILPQKFIVVIPSVRDYRPPTKNDLIDLVNNRLNRETDSPRYEKRSLSSKSREDIFAALAAILRAK